MQDNQQTEQPSPREIEGSPQPQVATPPTPEPDPELWVSAIKGLGDKDLQQIIGRGDEQ